MEASPSTQEHVLVRFKIITGDFRTEPEVLAMLHMEHPEVTIKIKNTRTSTDSINAAETRKRRRFDQSIPSMPHKKPAASISVQQLKDPVPPKAALYRHCT